MAETTKLAVEPRERAGKGAARAARRAGRIPGVIYGDGKAPTLIQMDPAALQREVVRPGFVTRLFDLQLNGGAERVLARDVQFHPVTDRAEHIDFMRVGATTRIRVSVPVIFVNQDKSPGLKRGGVLNVVRREVELVCPADAIPEQIEVDLAGADIGDSLHISRVTLPPNVHPAIADRDFTIATIAAPTVVAEEAAEEQEAVAEAERPAEEPSTESS